MAEIEERLPAGFHDAELLNNLSVDYVRSEAKLDFSLWTPSEEEREKYSAASLYLEGLQYLIIEPPSTEGEHYQSCVDGYVSAKSRFPIEGLPALKKESSPIPYSWSGGIRPYTSVRHPLVSSLQPS